MPIQVEQMTAMTVWAVFGSVLVSCSVSFVGQLTGNGVHVSKSKSPVPGRRPPTLRCCRLHPTYRGVPRMPE